jgi:predicted GTPase
MATTTIGNLRSASEQDIIIAFVTVRYHVTSRESFNVGFSRIMGATGVGKSSVKCSFFLHDAY